MMMGGANRGPSVEARVELVHQLNTGCRAGMREGWKDEFHFPYSLQEILCVKSIILFFYSMG